MILEDRISGKTKVICLIGNPVEHSMSPLLHNTVSREVGIDITYTAFKVESNELSEAVKGLKALNVIGFNVTVPYKKEIMKFLDENSKNALLVGAVNTVKIMDGRLYGYNTDADGFLRSYKDETGEGLNAKTVVILGAGGASRAVAVKAAMDGASEIHIINRTLSKALEIAEVINNNIRKCAYIHSSEKTEALDILKMADVIINCTTLGMYPDIDESPLPCGLFNNKQVVCDIVYNPTKTKLLSDAEKAGAKIMNGLGMLFYQGISAYEIWTGIKIGDDMLGELKEAFITGIKL